LQATDGVESSQDGCFVSLMELGECRWDTRGFGFNKDLIGVIKRRCGRLGHTRDGRQNQAKQAY